MLAGQEHPILDRNRVKLARTHAQKGVARRIGGLLDELEAVAVLPALRPPQPKARRVQKLLPRLRADRVAEYRLILATPQAIPAAILLIAPPDRKVSGGAHVAVDDCAVVHRRADELIALVADRRQKRIEVPALDDGGRARARRRRRYFGHAGDPNCARRSQGLFLQQRPSRR